MKFRLWVLENILLTRCQNRDMLLLTLSQNQDTESCAFRTKSYSFMMTGAMTGRRQEENECSN